MTPRKHLSGHGRSGQPRGNVVPPACQPISSWHPAPTRMTIIKAGNNKGKEGGGWGADGQLHQGKVWLLLTCHMSRAGSPLGLTIPLAVPRRAVTPTSEQTNPSLKGSQQHMVP